MKSISCEEERGGESSVLSAVSVIQTLSESIHTSTHHLTFFHFQALGVSGACSLNTSGLLGNCGSPWCFQLAWMKAIQESKASQNSNVLQTGGTEAMFIIMCIICLKVHVSGVYCRCRSAVMIHSQIALEILESCLIRYIQATQQGWICINDTFHWLLRFLPPLLCVGAILEAMNF